MLYADIPYEGTDNSAYRNAGKFDWREFEDWASKLDVPVYVSSTKALKGFTEIWSKDINNGSNGTRTERLFVQDKFAMQHYIAKAEASTETNPTDAQKEAGNYKKGHVKIDGFDFTVENPKGSERSGKDADGKPWSVTMNNTYGYIRGTVGVDGDHIDMFLSENPEEGKVYVIDQVNADGSFDEHKVMYGFNSEEEARSNYLANYSNGWTGLGSITEVSKEQFKKWIDSSHRKTKPFSEYKGIKYSLSIKPEEAKKRYQEISEELKSMGINLNAQGNPIDKNGRYVVERLESTSDITENDYIAPYRNIELASLDKKTDSAIGGNGRNVLIKRNIFQKNLINHTELNPSDSDVILNSGLYHSNKAINDKPKSKPNYWVVTKMGEKSVLVNLDTDQNKTHIEVVGWRYINDEDIQRIERRAAREGGQVLITNLGAADLSALPGSSSADKGTANSASVQGNAQENVGDTAQKGESVKKSLTPAQDNQVHSDNFKEWFGDWENDPENASKVVDEEGKPLEVYHGTYKAGHSQFKSNGIGIYFTDNQPATKDYAALSEGEAFPEATIRDFTDGMDVVDYVDKNGIDAYLRNVETYINEGGLTNDYVDEVTPQDVKLTVENNGIKMEAILTSVTHL